jgi:hypothetical protein
MESSHISLSELEAAKAAARRALLEQDPEMAQAIANQTLHPQLWKAIEFPAWEERLPRTCKAFDDDLPEE